LGRIGIATASFVAVLGAAGLAIGLALQGSLSNFASGVMLICFRPVKVGEYITGGGAEGTVQEISIFSTTILTVDNKVIVVPNSAILNGNIVNFSRMPERRVDMSFSVSYGADFREVKKLLTKIADSNDKIIHDDKHAYGIVVTDLAAPVMKIAVRVWVKNADYFDVLGKFTEDAKLAFDANKVAPAAVPSLNVLNSK
ncbi:MAG: mechanosensitive ion channel domain-containing protein, partial [Prevotella sp.]|nr:mechanosensitive ion channel domain-containing protein [Prevotella sp.]